MNDTITYKETQNLKFDLHRENGASHIFENSFMIQKNSSTINPYRDN